MEARIHSQSPLPPIVPIGGPQRPASVSAPEAPARTVAVTAPAVRTLSQPSPPRPPVKTEELTFAQTKLGATLEKIDKNSTVSLWRSVKERFWPPKSSGAQVAIETGLTATVAIGSGVAIPYAAAAAKSAAAKGVAASTAKVIGVGALKALGSIGAGFVWPVAVAVVGTFVLYKLTRAVLDWRKDKAEVMKQKELAILDQLFTKHGPGGVGVDEIRSKFEKGGSEKERLATLRADLVLWTDFQALKNSLKKENLV
jgi:hypothetical protein